MILSPPQIRVLGALIEKEITTPEVYPLSLNMLQAASNQRSSRDPVTDLTEGEIRTALRQLEDLGLAGPARASLHAPAGRVSKFEHHARTALNLRRDEIAVLCLLLLRGPQTPGELRSRAERLFAFEDLAAVTATLDRLAAAAPAANSFPEPLRPLVAALARQPGSREVRYTHLLGTQELSASVSVPSPFLTKAEDTYPSATAMQELTARLAELSARFAALERLVESRAAELEHRIAQLETSRGPDARKPLQ